MIALLVVLVVLALLIAAFAAPAVPPRQARPAEPASDADIDDPYALAVSDPVEALKRYGTPEVAEQLRGQGVVLAALGYREGGEA